MSYCTRVLRAQVKTRGDAKVQKNREKHEKERASYEMSFLVPSFSEVNTVWPLTIGGAFTGYCDSNSRTSEASDWHWHCHCHCQSARDDLLAIEVPRCSNFSEHEVRSWKIGHWETKGRDRRADVRRMNVAKFVNSSESKNEESREMKFKTLRNHVPTASISLSFRGRYIQCVSYVAQVCEGSARFKVGFQDGGEGVVKIKKCILSCRKIA